MEGVTESFCIPKCKNLGPVNLNLITIRSESDRIDIQVKICGVHHRRAPSMQGAGPGNAALVAASGPTTYTQISSWGLRADSSNEVKGTGGPERL